MGCGRVGSGLALELDRAGHTVAVVDRDPGALAKRLGDRFSGLRVAGFGFDREVLDSAGARNADAFVAVTSGDNTNIVAARIARETYGIPAVVARIYDPGRAALYQRLGIPTVATVAWTTGQIMARLLPARTPPQWTDPFGDLELRQLTPPETWAGHRYRDLGTVGTLSVVAVSRDGTTVSVGDDLVCQEGDIVFAMIPTGAGGDLAARSSPGARR